jgi:RNA polymerase sigma factor (sigma-70 family)
MNTLDTSPKGDTLPTTSVAIQDLFDKLYRKTAKKIISNLRKIGADKFEAEDSYHDALKTVLLRYCQNKLPLNGQDLEKYLWTVSRNNLIKHLKTKNIYIKQEFEDVFVEEELEENHLLKSQIAEKCISLVGTKCKEILTEKLLKNKKHNEIAQQLGEKEETIKKRYQRCLEDIYKLADYKKLRSIYYGD